jgi:hypothetical protein
LHDRKRRATVSSASMLVDGRALICGCSGFSKPANTPNRFIDK